MRHQLLSRCHLLQVLQRRPDPLLLPPPRCRAMAVDVGGMRKAYPGRSAAFDVADLVSKEPLGQFRAWFEAASACDEVDEPNAVCLATADDKGVPSARCDCNRTDALACSRYRDL